MSYDGTRGQRKVGNPLGMQGACPGAGVAVEGGHGEDADGPTSPSGTCLCAWRRVSPFSDRGLVSCPCLMENQGLQHPGEGLIISLM